MRNLKKLLALVVACVMVFGVVASAAVMQFPDVASTAKYAEAVKVLSALNIINGDDKGNFNPDQNVTRAEMAKILCALVGKSTAGQVATKFDDVTAEHWASGYVAYAAGLGYINGYSDSAFGPEDNVTYEQAIKLIVAALGYTYMAEDKGGYPSGYMMVAADLKLTNKVTITDSTAPAKRSDIAILAYNALEVNLMERVTYGTEAKYEPVAKNLLNNKLGVYRFEGEVKATYKTTAALEDGEINFDITKTTAAAIKALELVADASGYYHLNAYVCQDDAATDLVLYASNAYVAENEDGEYEIIAVVSKASKTKEIVFEDLDVLTDPVAENAGLELEEKMDIANGTFSYWSNADHDDKRPEALEIDAAAQAIINNAAPVAATNALIPTVGSLKLVDKDNDGDYDIFYVKSYEIAVIDAVYANTETIRFKRAGSTAINTGSITSVVLNEDAAKNLIELNVTIDGEAAKVTDLAKNDVVYIAANDAFGAGFDPTFVEIIASRKIVEGKVRSDVNSDCEVEIGAETLVVYDDSTFKAGFSINDEGKFFLTVDGVIAAVDTTATVANEYAYLYKVGTSSFGDKSLRMLTAKGEDVTYDVADRIAINGVQTSDKKATTDYSAATVDAILGTSGNTAMSPVEIIEGVVNGTITRSGKDLKLVAYKVSGTELVELYIATESAYDDTKFGTTTASSQEWVATLNKFKGSETLADGAKIFMIDPLADGIADWKVVDAATLVNEKDYTVSFYGYNKAGEFNVALITSGSLDADTTSALAYYVDKNTTAYGEDETATKVTFIQGGEEKTMFVLDTDSSALTALAGLSLGDAFIYANDDEEGVMTGIVELYTPVANVENDLFAGSVSASTFTAGFNGSLVTAGQDYMFTGTTLYSADNEVMAGIIATVDSVEGGLKVKLAQGTAVKASDLVYIIPDSANVVVLNNKLSKNKLYASTLDSIQPSAYVAKDNGDIDTVVAGDADGNGIDDTKDATTLYYAMIRMYNDVVTDVYVINYDNELPKYTK